jgi:tripartite-type tricarboxylate transporter receptor subunit TctC
MRQTFRFLGLAATTAVAAGLVLSAPGAQAQSYPSKQIRVVIAFPPGGPTDAIGRVIFNELAKKMGQAMVIDNRPGAGGTVAADLVAKAPADGYTLLYASSTIATAPALYKRADMDPAKFLAPVACTVSVPFALLVKPDLPAKNLGEFAQLMKREPGKFFQGSSGNGSPDHLTGVLFGKELGLQFTHVPYKGNAAALTDLAGGNVNFVFAGALQTALPLVKDGRLRVLAVTSPKRSALMPDVPTVSESLIKGFDTGTWQALVAPMGTPPEVVKLLNTKMNEVLADPAVKDKLLQQGAESIAATPSQCGSYIQKEYARWTDVIRANKVQVD